jgi:hypothetical protein
MVFDPHGIFRECLTFLTGLTHPFIAFSVFSWKCGKKEMGKIPILSKLKKNDPEGRIRIRILVTTF